MLCGWSSFQCGTEESYYDLLIILELFHTFHSQEVPFLVVKHSLWGPLFVLGADLLPLPVSIILASYANTDIFVIRLKIEPSENLGN